jgi:hypothetical protein
MELSTCVGGCKQLSAGSKRTRHRADWQKHLAESNTAKYKDGLTHDQTGLSLGTAQNSPAQGIIELKSCIYIHMYVQS